MKKNKEKRYRLDDEIASKLGLSINKQKRYRLSDIQEDFLFNTVTETNDYEPKKQFFTAISGDGKIMNIETYCKYYGLDFDKVRSFKLVSHTGVPFYNIAFYENDVEEEGEIDFLSIFKDKIKPIIPTYVRKKSDCSDFDRLVISDIHVGMEVNPDGYALYGGEWNEKELSIRLSKVVNYVVAHQKSKSLILHDLGDLMDGWDGYTTRGGHKLPQNMDNQQAYDVAVKFKIQLIDSLIPFYDEVKIVNICNDNHGGAFTYVVNSAFKTYVELKYSNVSVVNQRKFIDHYFIGNRCFILTHGKDDKSLKFGFKPILDSKQIEKIKNYIDENRLHNHKIEFSKGDSHQLLFDSSTSKHFEYQNFGAFSPPSNWVQTNFQNSISSFTFFNYFEDQKTQHNYIF